MNFIPLHVRSCYSLLNSGLTIETMMEVAKKRDFPTVAVADQGVFYSWSFLEAYTEKNELKPLYGIDLLVADVELTFFVNNEEGYRLLTRLTPSLDKGDGLNLADVACNHDGLTVIFPSQNELFLKLINQDPAQAARYLRDFSQGFKRFFIGLEINTQKDLTHAELVRSFAQKYDYQVVAFPLILYPTAKDAITLRILQAIKNDEQLESEEFEGPFYYLSEQELAAYYRLEELALTKQIADFATFTFGQKRGRLINFTKDELGLSRDFLRQQVENGANQREINLRVEPYLSRVEYELNIIDQKGFNDYFLIVADYVRFAKDNNIFVGPGRGSAAGALISYLLGITEIDPLPHDLLFERFLNPERQTTPDIDIDFEDYRRDEIIAYLRKRYGKEHVANIITYITIGAKQALRDIGRIYNFPNRDVDLLSKKITDPNLTLRQAYRASPEFRNLINSDDYYLKIVTLAQKIEGFPRQTGIHAAGIILNDCPLPEVLPVLCDTEGNMLSQLEMSTLENQGFLKMDILGLTNLTTIHRCLDLIAENYQQNFDIATLPFDTPEVYQLIASGDTLGIFQLETSMMKGAIRKIAPTCFDDIVAILALCRPGPIHYIDVYAQRKKTGKKYLHAIPSLTPILASTYGIIVYQEQIMQILEKMGGFSLAEADLFRRNLFKKKRDENLDNPFSSMEEWFLSRAMKNNYSEKDARLVYQDILEFANYGFNKSHSVAYSRLCCQMAYLKAFYPAEFYATILENISGKDAKFTGFITELKRRKIAITGPDINQSGTSFIAKEKHLIFPFSSIDTINNPLAELIVKEREIRGKFESLTDFVVRTNEKISAVQLRKLIDAGTFDSLHHSRATLRHNLDRILQYASLVGGVSEQKLFDDTLLPPPHIIEVADNHLDNLEYEQSALGFIASRDPLQIYRPLFAQKKIMTINERLSSYVDDPRPVVGIIQNIKTIRTKKGEPMAFVTVFDNLETLEIVVFPRLYQQVKSRLEKNAIIVVSGKLSARNQLHLLADTLTLLEDYS
ncbi:MAG: DNA polymerase III subunit alpha [Bacilli bacterium]